MALKVKGTPKAGPKKRRAKTEAEAIRAAVDEHGVSRPKLGRGKGKVRQYSYKETEVQKRKRASAFEREQERLYGLRTPDAPSEFDVFKDGLRNDQRPFAVVYFQMGCDHIDEPVCLATSLEGAEPTHVLCKRCNSMRNWYGTKTETKRQEWNSYCPDGYDMFDWQDLYLKDRSMWQFIHDEVLTEMTNEAMTSEEVAHA